MCFFSEHGHFVLASNGKVLTSKTKRAAARNRPCGKRGAICAYHAVGRGVISEDLYIRLVNEEEPRMGAEVEQRR